MDRREFGSGAPPVFDDVADGTELLGGSSYWNRGKRFTVRFHLHPNVEATLIKNGNTVLLKPAVDAGGN